jgi:hypothetical protein
VSGGNIFAVDGNASILEYNATTGAPVGSGTFLTGLHGPQGIAISGSDIFVANDFLNSSNKWTIGEYTTSGATVNANLVSSTTLLFEPDSIAISGSNLYVSNFGNHTVTEFSLSGSTATPIGTGTLVSGLIGNTVGVSAFGSDIFVSNDSAGASDVGEYTTSGSTVNASLITPGEPTGGITVIPEPSAWALLAAGAGLLIAFRAKSKRGIAGLLK